MADRLTVSQLKPGHQVRVQALNQGPEWQEVEWTEQVDEGTTSPIFKIKFRKSTFLLYCDDEREFEVQSTVARPYVSGLIIP